MAKGLKAKGFFRNLRIIAMSSSSGYRRSKIAFSVLFFFTAEELEVPEIRNYLTKYRDFTDKIASMLKKLADDFTDEKVDDISSEIDGLKEVIPAIYDDLISLAVNLKDENIEQFKKPGRELLKDSTTNQGL